ncbi:MAG: HNH endonuclease [Dehalococcoidales bacterium]|nr:HNH endonuclease [Dehalococcoidales bacterium]
MYITRKGHIYLSSKYQPKYPNGKPFYLSMEPNRKKVLERDGHLCQMCGAQDDLEVHHKDNRGPHIAGAEADNSLSNLITLCPSCHQRLHRKVIGKHIKILSLRKQGMTYEEIGLRFGLSRQRIHQIIQYQNKRKAADPVPVTA